MIKLNLQLFASGVIALGVSGQMTGQVNWSSVSNGTNANSSNVYADLYVRRTDGYTTTGTFTGGLNIAGTTTSLSKYGNVSNGWVLVGSFSRTVSHNADGTCSIWIGGWVYGPSGTSLSGKGVSHGEMVNLDTIPRQATLTGATDFNDEGNPTLTYTNPAGFPINARLEFAGTSIQRNNIPNTGSYTFSLTDDERKLLRSKCTTSNSMTVREVIATLVSSNSENYWSIVDRTMTIVNANPTFSNFTFADVNDKTVALTGDNQSIIKGYSNIKITVATTDKASANKEATMKSYSFNDQKANYSDTEDVSITSNGVTNGTISVLAIDSRGNVTTATKVASGVLDYNPIKITSLSVARENGVSGDVNMSLRGTWWNSNFGQKANSFKVTYKIVNQSTKATTEGTTTITPTIEENDFSYYGHIAGDQTDTTFDINSSYSITVEASDELSTSSSTAILGTGIPAISIAKNGVGIFCRYDDSVGGYLQVNGQKIA